MGKQQGEQYYDNVWPGIIGNIENSKKLGEPVPWDPIWTDIANKIQRIGIKTVIDIGCGPGHLAQKLHAKFPEGLLMERYIGIDFSRTAIEHARNLRLPGFIFVWGDAVNEDWLKASEPENTAYVFCEFLEHVDDDLKVLNRVPEGATIILTVPSFDDIAHVRHFEDINKVVDRYEPFFLSRHPSDCSRDTFSTGHFMLSGVRSDYQLEPEAEKTFDADDAISLYMIVKDEERGLRRAIESCKELVVESVVLVDTATTDDTLNVAKNCGARTFTYNWTKNFAAARNDAMEDVRTKWGLVLDGHEYLSGDPNKIRKAIYEHPDAGGFELEVQMEDGKRHLDRHRLHKVEGARWENAQHNFLRVDGPIYPIEGVRIIHDREGGQSFESRLSRSKQRDEELVTGLRENIRKNPKDTRSMYYLAQQHRDSGRWEAAYYWYDRYNRTEGGNQWTEERFMASYNAGRCAIAIGDYDMALWHGKQSVDRIGNRAEGWALRGDAHYAEKEYQKAQASYDKAIQCDPPKNAKLPVDDTICNGGWKIMDQISMCAWHLGQYQKGKILCQMLLKNSGLPPRERSRVEENLRWHTKKLKELEGTES